MATAEATARRGWWWLAAWALSAALIGAYLLLPDGDPDDPFEALDKSNEGGALQRLEVIAVSPADPSAGSALTLRYVGGSGATESLRAFVGKRELRVLSRRTGALVLQVPSDIGRGHLKVRIASASERSKPYDVRVKAVNWRKPFRNLVGGVALLVLGVSMLSRGARGMIGLEAAQRVARVTQRRFAALSVGAIVGALMQSTTAVAGLLAGLVGSGVVALTPAAAAFLGAQLGAAATPVLVAGIIEPREGLLVVAIGVLWLGFARDRRAAALARLVLGAGLLAFALQVLRPGLEPFVANPELLSLVERWGKPGPLAVVSAALLGAVLVAIFQGPAPVLVLALGIAEASGHWNLHAMLALLSGASLGAALGALLTTPASSGIEPAFRGGAISIPRSRRLAELNLVAAACSSVLAVAGIDVFIALSQRLMAGHTHEVRWGKHVLLPGVGWQLAVAFALSQLASTLITLALLPWLETWLARVRKEHASVPAAAAGDASVAVRAGLLSTLAIQRRALDPIAELALHGSRAAGRAGEHQLADAHQGLQRLLTGPLLQLPSNEAGAELTRAAFACLQLQRSLEGVLSQAERLTDGRIAAALGRVEAVPLAAADQGVLREIHALLAAGLDSVRSCFETRDAPDLDEACTREIRINGIEARARNALLSGELLTSRVHDHLAVLELVDAYEAAGNQVFRVAEALGETTSQLDSNLAAAG